VGEARLLSLVPPAQPVGLDQASLDQEKWSDPGQFDVWRIGLRRKVLTHVTEFVAERSAV
jgi:hypothetical protein